MGQKTLVEKHKKTERGLALTLLSIWEAWGVVDHFLPHFTVKNIEVANQFRSSVDATVTHVIPVAITIGLIGILMWKKWGAYVLFITWACLFINGLIGFFFLSPRYNSELLGGISIFTLLSLTHMLIWYFAIKRKWHLFS